MTKFNLLTKPYYTIQKLIQWRKTKLFSHNLGKWNHILWTTKTAHNKVHINTSYTVTPQAPIYINIKHKPQITQNKIKNGQQSNMYSRIKIQYILRIVLTTRKPHIRIQNWLLRVLFFSSLLMISCWFFLGFVVATVGIPANDQAMLCGGGEGQ